MSGHSKTKMSVSGYLITVGALVWWVAANGDNTADQHKSLDDNRMTEQLICRSESAEGVMSFSDFPGDCAREGDTVTISVSVPRQADIQLHKEQYREIMDLLDRMAAERHRRELISIERRQLDLELGRDDYERIVRTALSGHMGAGAVQVPPRCQPETRPMLSMALR